MGVDAHPVEPDFTILDVGCGGGRTILRLLDLAPAGKVYGLDYAGANWPDLSAALGEVCRVLKPGGCVAIIAEAYRGKRFDGRDRLAMRLLGGTVLTTREHRDVLIDAGFIDVEVFEEAQKGWICVVGRLEN